MRRGVWEKEYPTFMRRHDHRKAIATIFAAVAFLFCLDDRIATATEPEAESELATFAAGLAAYDAGNFGEALHSWKPLASRGHVEAQLAVAQIYEDGLGVVRDLSLARRLYRSAAQAGSGLGALNYGDFLFRGVGGPQDPAGAYVWMRRAADLGRKWAAVKKEEIFESLSAAEREDAARRWEGFKESNVPSP
jgi:TPR repeat protein